MNASLYPMRTERRLTPSPVLSIVIPVYNEKAVLGLCLMRLERVLADLGESYELLFVDDGSSDGSGAFLAQQAHKNCAIRLIRLSRNFGKEAALTAGIDHAAGQALIILDADLQDPPELIPQMVNLWRQGADVVLMRRRSRAGETAFKRLSAHLFYRLLNRLSACDIPRDTGDFRLMNRRAVDALRRLPERNRYMKGLFAWIGMETRVIDYDREPRAAGTTKWNYGALFRLALEGITSFSVAPLRWASAFGLVAALGGTLFGLWIVFKTLVMGDAVQGYPSLMAMVTVLGGVQLLTIGILGEYVGKTYLETKQRPTYLVRETIGGGAVAAPAEVPTRQEYASHA